MTLQYEVDKNGMIIKVHELKGNSSYTVTSQKVEKFPAMLKMDRWAAFKRAVCTQELGVVMKYSGFKDEAELKRAKSVLYRGKDDVFMKNVLNGAILQLQVDTLELALYVAKVKNDN